MKKSVLRLFVATCLLTLLVASPSHAALQALDKIVVVVNQSVILQSELDERMQQVAQHANSQRMALPSESELRQQVLDHLISEALQLDTAQRVGFTLPDQQINETLDRIRLSKNLSWPAFKDYVMQTEGISLETLREKVRRDLTIQQIQQAMVQQRIRISGLEVDNFLKSADAQFWMSPEYLLGHILLPLSQSAGVEAIEEARSEAEALSKRINDGTSFEEMAIAKSKGPAALKGGSLGWRKTSALPTLFAKVVPTLEIGQTSEPIRSPAGFHLLKLFEKKGEEQKVELQSKVRHILLETSEILNDQQAESKLKQIRQKIIDGADFAEMAKEHSKDIGSMLSGGDLGWSKPGMFVPEFEARVSEAEVGKISEPFKSNFGWHILEVQERRQEDITEDIIRNKAAQILTSRRFEDELQIWLRELRDEAFLDIKE